MWAQRRQHHHKLGLYFFIQLGKFVMVSFFPFCMTIFSFMPKHQKEKKWERRREKHKVFQFNDESKAASSGVKLEFISRYLFQLRGFQWIFTRQQLTYTEKQPGNLEFRVSMVGETWKRREKKVKIERIESRDDKVCSFVSRLATHNSVTRYDPFHVFGIPSSHT